MYGKYKVVCVTAAGRRRYLKYLIPMVLSSTLVDRYDLWINTNDHCDVEFMRRMCAAHDKLNFVRQPEEHCNGVYTLLSFWRHCQEQDTIYIRLDDDIIWLEPDFFEKLLKFRVEHRDYLFVSPLIINNAKCNYLLEMAGRLKLDRYVHSDCCGRLFWEEGYFAKELHEWFIDNYLEGDRSELYIGEQPIALCRFSINCMAWFGEDLKGMALQHEQQEEVYIIEILPVELHKSNCFFCDAIAVHYAFWKQRAVMDRTGLLGKYGASLEKRWKTDPVAEELYESAKRVENEVNASARELRKQRTIYESEFTQTGWNNVVFRIKCVFWKFYFPALERTSITWHKIRYRNHIVRSGDCI